MQVTSQAGKTYSYSDTRYSDPDRVDERKRTDGRKKTWQVAEMWDRHHEIARLILLGHSNKEVADRLDVTPQQVSNVRNSPIVKDKLSIMRAARDAGCIDLSKEIMELAPIALDRIKEVLQGGTVLGKEASAKDILKESNNLLDRQMGKAVQRVDARSVTAHLTMEDIERIKERAVALADYSGQLGEEGSGE